MNFVVAAQTDIGIRKQTNQDSLSLKVMNTATGPMAFGVLCDGMGGLSDGEIASANLIRAFDQWARVQLPRISEAPIDEQTIVHQWNDVIMNTNNNIRHYGDSRGINLGTTLCAILITQDKYYLVNIGDSRAYEIADTITQLTKDQTYVSTLVAQGLITEEQAKTHPQRSVLLQCVGVSGNVNPEYFFGTPKIGATYMLCCDGFIHEITSEEIFAGLQPNNNWSEEDLNRNARGLIELNMTRQEKDNISVAMIRTY